MMNKLIRMMGLQDARGIVSPADSSDFDACFLGGLDVPGLIADVNNLMGFDAFCLDQIF